MESALKRDRVIIIAALGAVILVSWLYVLTGAGMGMSAMEMTRASMGQDDGAHMGGDARGAMTNKAMSGAMTMMTPAGESTRYRVRAYWAVRYRISSTLVGGM